MEDHRGRVRDLGSPSARRFWALLLLIIETKSFSAASLMTAIR
jgi:hypothetical protein